MKLSEKKNRLDIIVLSRILRGTESEKGVCFFMTFLQQGQIVNSGRKEIRK